MKLKIEFDQVLKEQHKNEDPASLKPWHYTTHLIINGKYDHGSYYENMTDGTTMESIDSYRIGGLLDLECIQWISDEKRSSLKPYFEELALLNQMTWSAIRSYSTFYVNEKDVTTGLYFIILYIHAEHWDRPWSILQLQNTLLLGLQEYLNELDTDDPFVTQVEIFGFHKPESVQTPYAFYSDNDYSIYFKFREAEDYPLRQLSDKAVRVVEDLLKFAQTRLAESVSPDVLLTYFQFPKSIKAACIQYLVYFGQFLADLGLDAKIEVREQANDILFKVIPNEGTEALQFIKRALEVFLNAPGNSEAVTQFSSNDISVFQWQANVMHLKSQLMLYEATVKTLEDRIDVLKLSNYMLQALSAKAQAPTDAKEEIIPGILSISKLEGKGISLNLAEMLRRLKRKFSGK